MLAITARLPLVVLHGLARVWAAMLRRIPNRARATTLTNLQACFPDLDKQEVADMAGNSLQHTACTAMELGKAWLLPMSETLQLVKEAEGISEWQAAMEEEGTIVLAPHLGNWELFGFYLAERAAMTWLYQPPKLAPLDGLLRQVRSRNDINLVPTNRKGVAELLKAIKNGQSIGVLPDQVPQDEGGLHSEFFGVPAFTMTLVGRLLQRQSARVFCGFAERLPESRGFRIRMKEADSDIYSEDLELSVAALNRSVEACVREAPAQYQWEYKRFRKQADGSRFY